MYDGSHYFLTILSLNGEKNPPSEIVNDNFQLLICSKSGLCSNICSKSEITLGFMVFFYAIILKKHAIPY